MKIKYEFVTETTEIEVEDEWALILTDLNRQERNNNLKEKRRHYSLDACTYEGTGFAMDDEGLTRIFGRNAQEDKLYEAIGKLSNQQQDVVHKIYFEGYSVNEYAEVFGVDASAVSHRISRIKKRLKKFLSDRQI